ncbi:MAG: peptidylprolyl isomerase [Roseitalea sp.]|nr:peptidylprolyl isomerase [Roseitalea sp.]
MRLTRRLALAAIAALGLSGITVSASMAETNPADTMVITLKDGEVRVALRPALAPQHVEQIKTLVRQGAYDNVAFHRVIDGFMAQTGDVQFGDMEDGFSLRRAGTGGSDLPDLPAEFSDEPFMRGVVGMARSQNPNSANSQFFIMFDEGRFLDGQYTVVGQVVSGMEFVDGITRGSQAQNGAVAEPDRMIKVEMADQ